MASSACAGCGGRSPGTTDDDAAADGAGDVRVGVESATADGRVEVGPAAESASADVIIDAWLGAPPDASGSAVIQSDSGDASNETNTETGAAAGNADASASVCSAYCAAVMAACTGGNAQYKDNASCMSACAYFPLGTVGASSGDSRACRLTHAAYAMNAPNPHCWHAGPFGYGVCGTLYEGFCDIAAGPYVAQTANAFCSPSAGFDAGPAAYTSNADCWLRAAYYSKVNMPTTGQPPGRVGLDGGFSANGPAAGDTFDCRAYHLVLALQGGSAQQLECNNVGWSSPTCR